MFCNFFPKIYTRQNLTGWNRIEDGFFSEVHLWNHAGKRPEKTVVKVFHINDTLFAKGLWGTNVGLHSYEAIPEARRGNRMRIWKRFQCEVNRPKLNEHGSTLRPSSK